MKDMKMERVHIFLPFRFAVYLQAPSLSINQIQSLNHGFGYVQLKAPVFSLNNDNMGVTIGGPTVDFRDKELGRPFRVAVVNRGQSAILVEHAQTLKRIINNQRRN